jgi:hypothetical protein
MRDRVANAGAERVRCDSPVSNDRSEGSIVRPSLTLRRLRVLAAAGLLVASLATMTAVPAGATTVWFAFLSGDQEVPGPGDPDADGFARLTLDPGAGPDTGQVCVRWDVLGIDAATAAEIGTGAEGVAGTTLISLPTPDVDGLGDDCVTDLDSGVVQSIIDDPAGFFVNVHNAVFPAGAVRGQLEPIDVTRVTLAKAVCPPDIQSPADLAAAPVGTCTIAGLTGTIGDPPAGHTWDPEPLEFDMQVQLDDDGGQLTMDDVELDGGSTCGATTCAPGRTYTWSDVFVGPTTVTEQTFPAGYHFGWATLGPASGGGTVPAATVDTDAGSISFDTTGLGGEDGFVVRLYDFADVAPPSEPPPSEPPSAPPSASVPVATPAVPTIPPTDRFGARRASGAGGVGWYLAAVAALSTGAALFGARRRSRR